MPEEITAGQEVVDKVLNYIHNKKQPLNQADIDLLTSAYDQLIGEFKQEIARHHKDLERWENMASKGAAQLANWQMAQRILDIFFLTDHNFVPGTEEYDDAMDEALQMLTEFYSILEEDEEGSLGGLYHRASQGIGRS